MPSELITPIELRIVEKLKDPRRRRRLFLRMAQDEIAMQFRELREKRGFLTQAAFAKHAGMQQSAVSRIENADYQGWTFKTLHKVSDALDARIRIIVEPVEHVISQFQRGESPSVDAPANSGVIVSEQGSDAGPNGTTALSIVDDVDPPTDMLPSSDELETIGNIQIH